MRGYSFRRLLIVGTLADIEEHRYRSRAEPKAVIASVTAFGSQVRLTRDMVRLTCGCCKPDRTMGILLCEGARDNGAGGSGTIRQRNFRKDNPSMTHSNPQAARHMQVYNGIPPSHGRGTRDDRRLTRDCWQVPPQGTSPMGQPGEKLRATILAQNTYLRSQSRTET